MTEAIIIALIANLALLIKSLIDQHGIKRQTQQIGKDAKESRDQTANSHSTNLRDDLDTVLGVVRGVESGLEKQGAKLARIEGRLQMQHEDDEMLQLKLDRSREYHDDTLAMAVEDRREQFAELRRDIPAMIRHELNNHVYECPLRNEKERK